MQVLTKQVLNQIANLLYVGATVAFYSVTPTGGETLIATLIEGFIFARHQLARQKNESSDVQMWLAQDAAVTLAQLKSTGVVVITANGITTRYAITELLPQQQIGGGFVLRLSPQKGAAG